LKNIVSPTCVLEGCCCCAMCMEICRTTRLETAAARLKCLTGLTPKTATGSRFASWEHGQACPVGCCWHIVSFLAQALVDTETVTRREVFGSNLGRHTNYADSNLDTSHWCRRFYLEIYHCRVKSGVSAAVNIKSNIFLDMTPYSLIEFLINLLTALCSLGRIIFGHWIWRQCIPFYQIWSHCILGRKVKSLCFSN
jgi:hypothetical protein